MLSEAGRAVVGLGALVASVCLVLSPFQTGTKGGGLLNGVWSWCWERSGQTSKLLLYSTFLCVHLQYHCFILWDELIWGFDSRNSRGDAQNKPVKLKIAHLSCCCFQDKDVTR